VFHWSVALACLLIVAGALIASKDMLLRRPAIETRTSENASRL